MTLRRFSEGPRGFNSERRFLATWVHHPWRFRGPARKAMPQCPSLTNARGDRVGNKVFPPLRAFMVGMLRNIGVNVMLVVRRRGQICKELSR